MNQPLSDAGIPLLTEVISPAATPRETATESAGWADPIAVVPAPPAYSVTAGSAQDGLIASDAVPRDSSDTVKWDAIEREVRERVTGSLKLKIDAVIEQRTKEVLADLLQIAVDSITNEIRAGLHQAVADTVSETVTAEISLAKTKI